MDIRKILSVFLLCLPLLAQASPARLSQVQTSNTPTSSRLEFYLTQNNPTNVFMLSHPDRLVIDFANTRLAYNLKNISITHVSAIRAGHPDPETLRLVLDLNASAEIEHFFETEQHKLVIDAYFSAVPKRPVLQVQDRPRAPERIVMQAPERARPVIIVIDPGHGGKDTGAIGEQGTREKDVVLAISKQLAELINAQPGMRAELTRSGDYFVTLRDRLRLARKGKADVFVAIHADSFYTSHASGASVYALSKRGATSEAARWLAKRDNTSELGGVDLGELEDQSYILRSVLIDLAQTATVTDSLHLGVSILDSLEDITRLHYSRVEQAPFVVLKSPDIPSVLVETGFISNVKEEQRLRDRNYQIKVAQALLVGIKDYIKKYPPGV